MRTIVLAVLLMAAAASPARAAGSERFILHDVPRTVPSLSFADGAGRPRSLDEFRGKVVLLNIWATWCGPCRKEMPALDRLQAAFGGPGFELVALSVDRTGVEAVKRFYTQTGVHHLALYIDSSGKAAGEFNAFGLPMTLLIDRDGRELGRLLGPAEWDSPELIGFLTAVVSNRTGRPMQRSIKGRASPDPPAFIPRQKEHPR